MNDQVLKTRPVDHIARKALDVESVVAFHVDTVGCSVEKLEKYTDGLNYWQVKMHD